MSDGEYVDSYIDQDGLVSSVFVDRVGNMEHVTVFNRGIKAGTLVVGLGDGSKILERLKDRGASDVEG